MSVRSIVFAFAVFAAGCASSSDSTTGKRIVLHTRITAGPEATQPFANSAGWTVSLSKLVVSTGALYYFDGATIFSRVEPPRPSPVERIESFFIGTAYAHPGHYIPGTARGQMLTPSSVDLHGGGEVALPDGEGITGTARSATFSFGNPPSGPAASELGAHLVVVEGSATKGPDTRLFRAEIDAADILNTKSAPAVEGCPFTEVDMQSDGVVTVSIKLALWFDQVEFDSMPASTDGKPVLMNSTEIARSELVRGMKAGDGYVFSYAPSAK